MNSPILQASKAVVLEPTRESPQFGGLFIAAVIASTTAMLLLLAPDTGWPVRISVTAFILLTLKYWGSVLVLMAVQLDLFLREPPRSAALNGPTGMLTVFLVVGLLMLINRNRDLLHRASKRPLSWVIRGITSLFRGDPAIESGKTVREISRILGAILRGIAVLIGCVFVSRILLGTLPNRRTLNNDLGTWMLNETSVLRCSLLLGSIVAAWIVCNEISWRQLTQGQARLYLRSVFLTIHHADLRMIVRHRLKRRRRAASKPGNPKTPSGVLNQKNFAGNEQ